MRIENNKLVFETVICWNCNGKKQVKAIIWCKNNNKKMYGKPCQYCGSRSKYHKIVDYKMIECYTCKGQGTRLENKFDVISKIILNQIIKLTRFIYRAPDTRNISLDTRFIAACFSAKNSFAGAQDYIDHRLSEPEIILNKVLNSAVPMQALNYIDSESNELKLNVAYWGYIGGYTSDWI